MREIEVETFLDPMEMGVSRPVLILGDDQNEYILKNQKVTANGETVTFNCMFVNELLAYQIGCYLGVPMPEAEIAFVDELLVENDPKVRFAYKFEKGKYFATERLKYVENNLKDNFMDLVRMGKPYRIKAWNRFFENISNKEDIAKILAFDIFIANFDRYRNEGNILVNREEPRKMYAIDHGHAFFGPKWEHQKVQCLGLINTTEKYIQEYTEAILRYIPGVMFNAFQEYVDLTDINNNPFDEITQKIINIDESMIELWMNNIPSEWYVNRSMQSAYYTNFLLKHKDIVRNVIQNIVSRDVFSNYKGGVLQWNNQKPKSHIV